MTLPGSCAVVGAGRLGRALVAALPGVGGPFGRGFDGVGYDIVVLAVPDAEIAAAGATIKLGPLVGHCSGATGLDVLAPHESFSLHPLMTVANEGATFAGAGGAVAGTTARALRTARVLAEMLGLDTVQINDADRAAYHAAASIAANFLITLEDAAETLLRSAGVGREILVPLVRAAVENWAASGTDALTGPIARGDEATVSLQREAVAERTPELLELFDTLAARTRVLVRRAK